MAKKLVRRRISLLLLVFACRINFLNYILINNIQFDIIQSQHIVLLITDDIPLDG